MSGDGRPPPVHVRDDVRQPGCAVDGPHHRLGQARLRIERLTVLGRLPEVGQEGLGLGLVGIDEAELWPEVERRRQVGASGIIAIYPHRWAVPRSVWLHLFETAEREISILAYSGLFLADDAGIIRLLAEKAKAGVSVRILLGDPDSQAVADRGTDEAIGPDVMSAKIRNALVLYEPLRELEAAEIRLHSAILYKSLYRADDELIVNAHIYGTPAAQAPVWHIRTTDNADLLTTYLDSYERVWNAAHPYTPEP